MTEKKALVLISDGTEDIEVITILDVLHRGGIHVTSCGIQVQPDRLCHCAHGTIIQSTIRLDDIPDGKDQDAFLQSYDLLAVPGGMKGVETFCCVNMNERVKKIANYFFNNRSIGLICAGPLLLKAAQIAQSFHITSYPSFEKDLSSLYKFSSGDKVVVDRNVITSQGPATAMPFALALIAHLNGEDASKKIGNALLYY